MKELPGRAIGEDIERWPDHCFGQARSCLLCGSGSVEPFLDGVRDWYFEVVPGDFAYGRCQSCQSLVLSRPLVAEHLGRAYARYYTHALRPRGQSRRSLAHRAWHAWSEAYVRSEILGTGSMTDAVLARLIRLLQHRRLELDVRFRFVPSPTADVLDYGCGNGDYLALIAAIGGKATGVEFDAEAAAVARGRGIAVLAPDDPALGQLRGRFDLITANHVIEHVPDPAGLLADFHRWLKPGGMLYLEAPNARARGLGHFGCFWRGLEAPRHLCVPSEAGLRRALAHAGFEEPRMIRRGFVDRGMFAESAAGLRRHAIGKAHGIVRAGLDGPEVLTLVARANG